MDHHTLVSGEEGGEGGGGGGGGGGRECGSYTEQENGSYRPGVWGGHIINATLLA